MRVCNYQRLLEHSFNKGHSFSRVKELSNLLGDAELRTPQETNMNLQEKTDGWMQTTLYFGLDVPGGGVISDAQFGTFLETTVTKEFPQGLTAYKAYGQMQHKNGTLEKQTTEVVLIVHPKSDASAAAIDKVITDYRSEFAGPQVMRTTGSVDVEFFQSASD